MGAADSKVTPPASEHLFNEEERATLQEVFRSASPTPPPPSSKTKEHLISFSSFQHLMGSMVPEGLHQEIYANFVGVASGGASSHEGMR
jgi:hypothetical protein